MFIVCINKPRDYRERNDTPSIMCASTANFRIHSQQKLDEHKEIWEMQDMVFRAQFPVKDQVK